MTANRHVKYTEALATATAAGWRFTTAQPRSNILYQALLLSGFRWDFVNKRWVKWHQSYVVLGEAS